MKTLMMLMLLTLANCGLVGLSNHDFELQRINADLAAHGVPGPPIRNGDDFAQRMDAIHLDTSNCEMIGRYPQAGVALWCKMPWGAIYNVSNP
jgi:hypothetical protein